MDLQTDFTVLEKALESVETSARCEKYEFLEALIKVTILLCARLYLAQELGEFKDFAT